MPRLKFNLQSALVATTILAVWSAYVARAESPGQALFAFVVALPLTLPFVLIGRPVLGAIIVGMLLVIAMYFIPK